MAVFGKNLEITVEVFGNGDSLLGDYLSFAFLDSYDTTFVVLSSYSVS